MVNGIHDLITQASSNQQESGKTDEKTTKQNGAITQPNTPGKVIAEQDGVKVTNNYKSDDHGPAHVHIDGQGESTKVGMNGKPLDGSPELSSKQQKVVDQNKGAIRKAVDQIQRYKRPVKRLALKRSKTASGSSALWITTSVISIWRRKLCSPSTIPSTQKCYLCLRNILLPMSPG